jgi:hypothetical protein
MLALDAKASGQDEVCELERFTSRPEAFIAHRDHGWWAVQGPGHHG